MKLTDLRLLLKCIFQHILKSFTVTNDEVFYKRKYDDMEGIVKEVDYYKEYNLLKHQYELYTIKEITNRSSIDIDN